MEINSGDVLCFLSSLSLPFNFVACRSSGSCTCQILSPCQSKREREREELNKRERAPTPRFDSRLDELYTSRSRGLSLSLSLSFAFDFVCIFQLYCLRL